LHALLRRIVKSGDSSHICLEERRPHEVEVIEEIGVLLKLRLKDKTPPCIIKFQKTRSKRETFKLFYSCDVREPDETTNSGSEVDVRSLASEFHALIFSVANQDCVDRGAHGEGRRRSSALECLRQRVAIFESAV